VEIVLRTETPEGIEVVLVAIVYAKIVEEHAAVADLELIDRTVRHPDERRRIRGPAANASSGKTPAAGCSPLSNSGRYLQSLSPCS
jgi:hypothetical protein